MDYQTDSIARSWRYNPELEAAIRMRSEEPSKFDALAPSIKTSLGYYESAKTTAAAQGIDTTGGHR